MTNAQGKGIESKIEFILSNYVVYGSPVNERTKLAEEIAQAIHQHYTERYILIEREKNENKLKIILTILKNLEREGVI